MEEFLKNYILMHLDVQDIKVSDEILQDMCDIAMSSDIWYTLDEQIQDIINNYLQNK